MIDGKPRKLRLTLGGMLILVALIAVVIVYMKPAVTRIHDVKLGTGPPVKLGDMVTVHYVGTLADGKEFDSSKGRGQPIEFGVSRGMVIRGRDVGLIGMQPGGVRRLTIPPDEGYGEKGAPPAIPPNSALYFEIELIGIKPVVGQGAPAGE
jgi:FKBP-type peptidyl-prolyl cis-trans isomerase